MSGGPSQERLDELAHRGEPGTRVRVDADPVGEVVTGIERLRVPAGEALDRRAPHPRRVRRALGREDFSYVSPGGDEVLWRPHRRAQVGTVHLPAVPEQDRL